MDLKIAQINSMVVIERVMIMMAVIVMEHLQPVERLVEQPVVLQNVKIV